MSEQTFDNTVSGEFFSEQSLDLMISRAQHDAGYAHEIEFWMEELKNPYGPNIRYRMWKTMKE